MPSDMEMRIALVEKEQAEFHEVITDIRDILDRLVRVEERHIESREALGRAFSAIKDEVQERKSLEDRVAVVETAIPPLQEARKWFVSGMLALIGVVLMALVGMVVGNPTSAQTAAITHQQPGSAP
ncbi:MAG: hypothetical protein HPY82_05760 [Gammaproteobacteria bacterium]|nr:hypothetical protein [Gammaproteobacteria bacterium]